MSMGDKWKNLTSGPQAQKAGGYLKKAETGLWKALDPVGRASNKLANRAGAESFWPTELADGEIEKAARILKTFSIIGAKADDDPRADAKGGVVGDGAGEAAQSGKDKYEARKTQKVIRKIPAKALQGACGVAIFTCFRTGLGWSGAGGSGVVLARLPDGSWGPPSGILIHTIGWGLLIGLDIYDVVLILRKPQALKAFEHPKISIGGELSVAAGPVGNGAVFDSGLEAAPCWSYTKSKGAYAGLQLDGTIVLKRDDANARLYGSKVSVSDIFEGRVRATPACTALLQTLYAAEGRPEVMGTQHIPQGLTPGDTEITEEEAKEMEAHNSGQAALSAETAADQTGQIPLPQQSTDEGAAMQGTSQSSVGSRTHRVPPPPPPPSSMTDLDPSSQGPSFDQQHEPPQDTSLPPAYTDTQQTGVSHTHPVEKR